MPGRPLVPRDNIYSRGADQMCRQDSRVHLSEEEERAAEESLSIYCKPVELYNILRCRAISSPSFLQRCLRYKQQAKNKHRIQMMISLSGTANNGLETQNLFPIYVMLARSLSDVAVAEPTVYHVSRVRLLTSNLGVEEVNHRSQVTFILPELKKLSEEVVKTSSILLVGGADISTLLCGDDLTINHTDMASCQLNIGRYSLWGNISLELFASWDTSSLSRERVEMLTTVNMRSCFVKTSSSDNKKSISFQTTKSISLQVPVNISAEEVGAKDKTPYDSCLYNDIPSSSLSNDVGGLRNGNVIFNYRYYNNKLQRTEVTSDFTCPFCLVKCASYKGLRLHLPSSHDLFNFEFRVNEEYQAVNVSVNTDQWSSEVVADGVDPKQQTFFFCAKPPNRRYPKSLLQKAKHVRPLVLDSNLPAATTEQHWGKINGCSSAAASFAADPECVQSASGSNIAPPAMLTFAKTRKLSAQGSDSRNRTLLQKRQFFHSHRAQPMALQQVFSDRDSEDEVDDDVADFEDRRMLDDFVDVTKDEKQMMHLWNSFVRKQRVLADGHIPWACESFSKLHGEELVLAPALLRCWRLFMVKLWNHGLLDARTMDKCNVILEQFGRQEDLDLMRS